MSIKKSLKSMFTYLPIPEDESKKVPSSYEVPDRIPYDVISHKLCRAMDANKDVIGDRILIPNYYRLFFNAADRELRKHSEGVMIDELEKNMLKEARKLDRNITEADFYLEIFSDESLDKGRIRIQCFFKEQPLENQSGSAIDFMIMQEENKIEEPELMEDELEAGEDTGSQEGSDLAEESESNEEHKEEVTAEVEEKAAPEDVPEETLDSIEADSLDVIVVEDESYVEEESGQITETKAGVDVNNSDENIILVIKVIDGNETALYNVDKDEIVIGRSDKADIRLPDDDYIVSRQHAVLKFSDDKIEIIPKGSNGTWLNDEELELENPIPVEFGDVIKIKDYRINIRQQNDD
ncbi:FHA domain-containing protein [candidate division KSB1 bacterium]